MTTQRNKPGTDGQLPNEDKGDQDENSPAQSPSVALYRDPQFLQLIRGTREGVKLGGGFAQDEDLMVALAALETPKDTPVPGGERQVEARLERAADFEIKNQELAALQDFLFQSGSAIDQTLLKQNCVKLIKAIIEQELKDGKLPEDQAKTLKETPGAAYNEKLEQLAAERIQAMLKGQIDIQIQLGKIAESDRKALESLVGQDLFPNVLVNSLLAHEYAKNEFGPITRAMYVSAVESGQGAASSNFLNLVRSGLPIPADCPIQMRLNEFGRPEVSESIRAGLQSGEYKPFFGVNTDRVPTADEMKILLRNTRWNEESSRIYTTYLADYQQKMLEESIVKIGRPEWLLKPGENRDQWMMRVGPLVDMTMQVKAVAQALSLVQKMSGSNKINFDRNDLKSRFPGTLTFNKDGTVKDIYLNIPHTLDPSFKQNREVEAIKTWLARNLEPARQATAELANAAADQGRLLVWQDRPSKGTFKDQPYDLECHRCAVENVVGKNKEGKDVPKIRVRNRVDYYQCGWFDPYDMTATKIGSEDCMSSDPEKRAALEKQFNELAEGAPLDENMQALKDAAARSPKAFNDKLDELSQVAYRDYEPHELVAVIKDGKVEMVLAGELEKWIADQEFYHKAAKAGMIALDCVFTAASLFGVGVALKGMQVAGAVANAAIRQMAMTAMKKQLASSLKGVVLGASGAFVHNAKWQNDEMLSWAGPIRMGAFGVDAAIGGAHLLRSGGTGLLRMTGVMKPLTLTQEARALQRVTDLAHSWSVPRATRTFGGGRALNLHQSMPRVVDALFKTGKVIDYGAKTALHASECYMIWDMGLGMSKRGGELVHPDNRPNMTQAGRILKRLHNDESDAVRFLNGATGTMAGGDRDKMAQFDQIKKQIAGIEKLPADERPAEISKLVQQYAVSRDQKEKIAIAAGLLSLSHKDGQFVDVIGSYEYKVKKSVGGRGGGTREVLERYTLKSSDLLSYIETSMTATDRTNKPLASPEVRMASSQCLAAFGRMTMPEYATTCREILGNANATQSLKMQALFGLGYCADVAGHNASAVQTPEERMASLSQSYGCNQQQLLKSIAGIAADKNQDKEVRAVAAALSQALNTGNPAETQALMSQIQASWKIVSKNAEIKLLEAELRKDNLEEGKRLAFEANIERSRLERDAAREALAALRDPALVIQPDGQIKEIDPEKMAAIPESFAKDFSERLFNLLKGTVPDEEDKRQNAIAGKLDAIHLLEISGADISPEQRKFITNLLVEELAVMNNGMVAVEAIKMIVPGRWEELDSQQKATVLQSVHDILNYSHLPSNSTSQEIDKRREVALAKQELIKALPGIIAGGFVSADEKATFIKELSSLLNRNSDNPNLATAYPTLRLAAVEALGNLGDKSKEVLERLRTSMKLDAADLRGDSDARVRMAAFQALKKLGDPELPKLIQDCIMLERDPRLASVFAQEEFSSLRPNREEHARRIFQYECEYWSSLLLRSRNTNSSERIQSVLRDTYPHAEPQRCQALALELEGQIATKKKAVDDDFYFFGWFRGGARTADKQKAETECREAFVKARAEAWTRLVSDASNSDAAGDSAREALLYLATCGGNDKRDAQGAVTENGGLQLEAAKVIRQLAIGQKEGNPTCPRMAMIYDRFSNAWGNDTTLTSHPHEARLEILETIKGLLDANPPRIEKQQAGRILHWALMNEMQKSGAVDDVGLVARQKAIIALLDKTEYPLALAQLHAIAQMNPQGRPQHTKEVIAQAAALVDKLHSTGSKNPQDLVAQSNLLREGVAGRQQMLRALTENPNNLNAMAGNDAVSMWRIMSQACSALPIRTVDDPRIPHLQTLLKDPDKGIAMAAAWFLVDSASPRNASDRRRHNDIVNQPYFKEAVAKLKEIAKSTDGKADDIKWKLDAENYLKYLEAWNVARAAKVETEVGAQISPEQRIFADAKAVLDGSKPNASLAEKQAAIENLVRTAANLHLAGDRERQLQAESVLRQVAASQDKTLARTAYQAIRSLSFQQAPISDQISMLGNGARIIEFANGERTSIVRGENDRLVTYPDRSWIRLNFNENNQVVSYTTSKFQSEKKAGQDFTLGSINMLRDGSIVFDEASGIRRIQRPGQDSWSFFREAFDLDGATQELDRVLKSSETTTEDKVVTIRLSISGGDIGGVGITASNDKRLTLLKGALSGSEDVVKVAAAKALLDHANTAVDEETRALAKSVLIQDWRNAGVINDRPIQEIINQMHGVMDLVGPITDANDARIGLLKEALHHESLPVRLEAARILASRRNSAIDKETRTDVLKMCADISASAYQRMDWVAYKNASAITKEAGKALGEINFTNSLGTTIHLKKGNPTFIQYPNGESMRFTWDDKDQMKSHTLYNRLWTLVYQNQDGSQCWKDVDGKEYGLTVTATADGAWGWCNYPGHKKHYEYYSPEGSCNLYNENNPVWRHQDGSIAYSDNQSNFSQFTDFAGAQRWASWSDSAWRVQDRDDRNGYENVEQVAGESRFDFRTGTRFITNKDGVRVGHTIYGSTITYNRADLPLSIAQGDKKIQFGYKPNTDILTDLKEADGTVWKREPEGKWKFKKAGADEWENFDGDIRVNFYGEYTFAKTGGTRTIIRLNGDRKST